MERKHKLNQSPGEGNVSIQLRDNLARSIRLLLPILALTLLLTNPWFSLIDDEAFQVGAAAQPFGIVATQFTTETGQWHPPLPDIILYGWLLLTRNSLTLLRVPSILFFTLGIWVASRVARRVAGASAGTASVILGALWPYGFHFGRYAVWFSFCFFLLACLVFCHLRWLERPTVNHLCWMVLVSIALLYTNYMGWAFLAVLGADSLLRPELRLRKHRRQLMLGLAILIVAYAPIWPVFIRLFEARSPALSLNAVLTFCYSLYVLFASEAIAPWVFVLSVPLIGCMLTCTVLILLKAPRLARTLYAGSLLLSVALMLSGEINQKRMMPFGAWLLISVGISTATIAPRWRRWLIVSVTIIGIISWFGILSRRYYATPRTFEPWQQIAHGAATSVLSGDTVLGSHPAFLLYLTRNLMAAQGLPASDYHGNYGEQVERSGIYSVRAWNAGGHPLSPHLLFVATLYGTDFEPTMEASAWLDAKCRRESTARFVENPASELKAKFFGPSQASPWRIEVRRYACNP